MKKMLKYSEVFERLHSLKPLLSRRDRIEKYGEEGKDERGQPTFVLKMESPNFKTFCDELAPFNKMTHEVELMTAKYSEAEGNLTGEEILAIDWMLED